MSALHQASNGRQIYHNKHSDVKRIITVQIKRYKAYFFAFFIG